VGWTGILGLSIELRQLIDQGALPRPRRSRQANYQRRPAVSKKLLEQIIPTRGMVLDHRDGASQGAQVAGADAGD